jgi:TPR repeat protein
MRVASARRIPPLALGFCLVAALAGFGLIPWVRANIRLAGSIWGASAGLLIFLFLLRHAVAQSGRVLRYRLVPRPVHYVQLAMHTSIYLYWGWYWREVYHYAPLIAAQIVFVYALDMLVCWSRRDEWILGFGPFPIVLSTNLFLWFKDDWFFLQFLMVSTGVLCKEFVTWNREGRRTHIFNPSAIALAIFSLGLLVTNSTHISWAEEVAVSLGRPPYIYFWIFSVGLVVQRLFSVTLVTLCAAATLFLLNVVYTASTGVYYFVDSTIPIAVFLGLHLLVTDPATSPRRNIGKALFGAIYGAAVFTLYGVLGRLGLPTFYDKLLCVPPMNLMVGALDRASVAIETRLSGVRWQFSPRALNLAHMSVWLALFAAMAGSGLVGGRHPGATSEFWNRACVEGRRGGCQTWIRTLNVSCTHGSGRACFTLGQVLDEGRVAPRDTGAAGKDFARACDLKTPGACASLVALVRKDGPDVFSGGCDRGDGESCFILASLYYGGAGLQKDFARGAALFRHSCEHGWPRGCGGLAECYRSGRGVEANAGQALRYFEEACGGGIAASCYAAGAMYQGKDGVLAAERFRQACDFSVHAEIANTAYFRASVTPQVETTPAFCAQPAPREAN